MFLMPRIVRPDSSRIRVTKTANTFRFARQEIPDGFECRRKRERTCQPIAPQWTVNAKRDG